jgi:integrase
LALEPSRAGRRRYHLPQASGALAVAYGAGLRASKSAGLEVRDVDSERMLLRVERGKGGQYRNAMLPHRPAGSLTAAGFQVLEATNWAAGLNLLERAIRLPQ